MVGFVCLGVSAWVFCLIDLFGFFSFFKVKPTDFLAGPPDYSYTELQKPFTDLIRNIKFLWYISYN